MSTARRGPPMAEAFLLVTVVFGLTLAAGIIGGPAASLPLVQILALGAPVAIYALVHPIPVGRLLGLERPAAPALAGAGIAGVGVLAINVAIILPLTFALLGEPERSPPVILEGSIAWQLLAVALIPAVCEELVFRGVLFRAMALRSATLAVVGSAAVFALFHMSPHRLAPTFAVGVVAGLCLWWSHSSWTAITAHLANNAALIALVPVGPELSEAPFGVLAGGGILLCGSGLWLTRRQAVQ